MGIPSEVSATMLSIQLVLLVLHPRAQHQLVSAGGCVSLRVPPTLCMGRGGKKKKSAPASSPPSAPPNPTPGRVNSDSRLSVRKQIAIARAYKAGLSGGSVKPKSRTSFRRNRDTQSDRAAANAASILADDASSFKYN